MRHSNAFASFIFSVVVASQAALAGGGPLGIDHKVSKDDSGIWSRTNQNVLRYGGVAVVIAGALWEGGETRLGKTFWQSVDATAVGIISSEGLKRVFGRERPSETDDPNRWFRGSSHHSFPSGEVTTITAAVTPFLLEYGRENPAVYALAVLPIYDAIARVKVQAHWQTDVVGGLALGAAVGYLAHARDSPFVFNVLPHAVTVGVRARF
jgi:membrane-associated phospholipid phosphatase